MNYRIFETTDKLVIDHWARTWCTFPYPNHPDGCPNYGKDENCPPKVGHVNDIFDLSKPHHFVVIRFDISKQERKMKLRHPEWSKKQCRCCLYWQGKVNRQLRDACQEAFKNMGTIFTLRPEAMGIDVFKTMKKLSIKLERRPNLYIFKVALIGYPKDLV